MRIDMKTGALKKLRYMNETVKMLERQGDRVKDRANTGLGTSEDIEPGFRMSSQPGTPRPSGRHRVTVAAVSIHARRHDRKHNTLLKSLGNG